jgi:excisionase family DNA binding protein
MTTLARALLDELEPDDLAALADALRPFLAPPARSEPDRWMDTRHAAAYLGMSVPALHKLTSARAIRFQQNVPGGKCYFKRSDLDAYRDR